MYRFTHAQSRHWQTLASCMYSRLLTTFSDRLSPKALLITFALLCMASHPTRSRTIYTLSNSPCRQSPSHCLNPSTISPSLTLGRYSQSPAIDLPDPQYQLVMSDLHSEADHDEATSSASTHINHYYIPNAWSGTY